MLQCQENLSCFTAPFVKGTLLTFPLELSASHEPNLVWYYFFQLIFKETLWPSPPRSPLSFDDSKDGEISQNSRTSLSTRTGQFICISAELKNVFVYKDRTVHLYFCRYLIHRVLEGLSYIGITHLDHCTRRPVKCAGCGQELLNQNHLGHIIKSESSTIVQAFIKFRQQMKTGSLKWVTTLNQ
jgi:hypothetical protein